MLGVLREDYRAFGLTPRRLAVGLLTLHPILLVWCYRISHWARRRRIPFFPMLLHTLGMILWHADISPDASIGPGFCIAHSVGIVVGRGVRTGSNLRLYQNVTLGSKTTVGDDMPTIGDNVTICAGAVVLGAIRVGSNVTIGANAVVIRDVPDNSVMVGNPACQVNNQRVNLR